MLFGFGRRSRRTGKTRRSAPFARRRRRLVEDRPESHRARGRDVRRRRRAGRRRDRRREHDAHEQTGGLRAAHVVRQVETGLPDRPVGLRGRIHARVHPPLLPQGHRSHERGAGAAARLHAEKGEQRPPHYDRVGRSRPHRRPRRRSVPRRANWTPRRSAAPTSRRCATTSKPCPQACRSTA